MSDSILLEIGRITLWQSRLEGQMALFLAELAEASGSAVSLSLSPRVSHKDLAELLYSQLVSQLGPANEYVTRFASLRKKILAAVIKRNEVVHSLWGFGPDFDGLAATRLSRIPKEVGGRQGATAVTLKDLQAISDEFEHVEWAVSDIRVRVCHFGSSEA